MTLAGYIDWGKDGSYTGRDDVTLRLRGSITATYGRPQSTALSSIASGSGSLTLDNASRDYSPRNTSSPLYGQLKPARPVLLQRTVSGTTYTLLAAHTDDSPINPDLNAKTVSISLVDWLSDFNQQKVTTDLWSGIRTGDAIDMVLDACGWTGGRDLDPGVTVLPWWWLAGSDGLNALQELVQAEGPPALLTIGSSGEIVFRDRHHRLTRAGSLTSQQTWRGSGVVEPIMGVGFAYDDAWRNVVNSHTQSVDVRAPGDQQVVWSSTATVDLSDGETKPISVTTTDPFTLAVTPDSTDMVLSIGSVTASLARTSGGATTIFLTAVGGPAQVTSLQLRAVPIPVARTVQITSTDSASVADYGARAMPQSIPWAGPYDAQAIADLVVATRAQPLTILTVTFQVGSGAPSARIAATLGLDLSDRVTVVEPETGLSSDFYVESISHELNGEVDHKVVIGLEAAPAAQTNILRFDTSGHGFNDGVFGTGLDDPANMFRFDTSTVGQRFDEGVFSA